jgi:uncharacterized membrane protein
MNKAKITFGAVFSLFFTAGFLGTLLKEDYPYSVVCFFGMILCNYFVISSYYRIQDQKRYVRKEPTLPGVVTPDLE